MNEFFSMINCRFAGKQKQLHHDRPDQIRKCIIVKHFHCLLLRSKRLFGIIYVYSISNKKNIIVVPIK